MVESRYTLVVDDEPGSLGELALSLLRSRIDVVHATGRDEAWLLIEQEKQRIGCVVFPGSLEASAVAGLLTKLDRMGGEEPVRAIAVGERPDEAVRMQLRQAGIGWAAWEPCNAAAIRLVIDAAMALPATIAPRGEPCAPVGLSCRIIRGATPSEALVYVLSPCGAYLETAHCAPQGERLQLQLPLNDDGESPVSAYAEVVWTSETRGGSSSRLPEGMGVRFDVGEDGLGERIRRHLAERFTI